LPHCTANVADGSIARITAPQHSPQLAESIRAAKRFWVMGLNRSRGRSLRQAAG